MQQTPQPHTNISHLLLACICSKRTLRCPLMCRFIPKELNNAQRAKWCLYAFQDTSKNVHKCNCLSGIQRPSHPFPRTHKHKDRKGLRGKRIVQVRVCSHTCVMPLASNACHTRRSTLPSVRVRSNRMFPLHPSAVSNPSAIYAQTEADQRSCATYRTPRICTQFWCIMEDDGSVQTEPHRTQRV